MAIIARGRIVKEGRPADLIAQLSGSIWTKAVNRGEVEQHRSRHTVISSHLYAGRSILHVLADSDPGDGFSAHEPDLEDVYFSTLLAHNSVVDEAA